MSKRLLSALLCAVILCVQMPFYAFAAVPDSPTLEGDTIYGNGFPLLVEAGDTTGTTVKYDSNSDGTYNITLVSNNENPLIIWGGSKTGSVTTASINMTGGVVSTIYAGGYGDNGGDAAVTYSSVAISGGTVSTVYGGGDSKYHYGDYATSNVSSSNISISGGNVGTLYASGAYAARDCDNSVTGESILISGGNIGNIVENAGALENTRNDYYGYNSVTINSFVISGGNINFDPTKISINPITNEDLARYVYKTELTFKDKDESNIVADETFTSLTTDAGYAYGMKDVTTDSNGKIYVWLPLHTVVSGAAAISGNKYTTGSTENIFKQLGLEITWPELTWATDLSYGKTWGEYITNSGSLTGSATFGGEDLPGTFTLLNATSKPNAGSQEYTILFKSTDGNYEKSNSSNITIEKANLTITAATVANKLYDGNTTASITSLSFGDVNLDSSTDYDATAAFATADASGSVTATVSVTLKGIAANNYSLVNNTFDTSAAIHSLEYFDYLAPTHEADGHREHYYCASCGKYFSDSQATDELQESDVTLTMIPHSYSPTWSNDETNHWHECECGDKADVAPHNFKMVRDAAYLKNAATTTNGAEYYLVCDCGAVSDSAFTTLATPSLTKSVSTKTGKVTLKWKAITGATGYKVYRATSKTGKYKLITTATGTSYTDTSATIGTTYYYKLLALADSRIKDSEYSSIISAKPVPAKVTGQKAKSASASSIKITWTKVTGASGYVIYRSTDNKTFKAVKTITSGSTVSFTNTSLTSNKKYYYKVRAYKTVNDTKVYGAYCSVCYATTDLAKVTGLKATVASTTSIKLTWTKVSGASGYVIYRSTDNKTFKAVKTITSGSTVSFKNTSLKKGKKYYYKIRAYKTVNGKKVYGAYSAVKYGTPK